MDEEESFFDLLTRFQSKRMDDQRCSLVVLDNKENQLIATHQPSALGMLAQKYHYKTVLEMPCLLYPIKDCNQVFLLEIKARLF